MQNKPNVKIIRQHLTLCLKRTYRKFLGKCGKKANPIQTQFSSDPAGSRRPQPHQDLKKRWTCPLLMNLTSMLYGTYCAKRTLTASPSAYPQTPASAPPEKPDPHPACSSALTSCAGKPLPAHHLRPSSPDAPPPPSHCSDPI